MENFKDILSYCHYKTSKTFKTKPNSIMNKKVCNTNDVTMQIKNKTEYLSSHPAKYIPFQRNPKNYRHVIETIESYFFNHIAYKQFDQKNTTKNNYRTISKNNCSKENTYCSSNVTMNSTGSNTCKQKLNLRDCDESGGSGYVNYYDETNSIDMRCVNVNDDENNNIEVPSKNYKSETLNRKFQTK